MKKITKNAAGIFLIFIGSAMLVLPGPGLLTILTGLYITSFPGKVSLVKKLKKTKFYHRYLINIESKIKSSEIKIKSKFKRKNK
ncbi:MAG: hypothetical protein L3J17_14930 [Candidatus Jettenia sp.]|nr:MAG: hypothetical protein L3J17_14930 [Candidatus Jettenia sp.]